jgi:hypothetical protein
MTSAIPDALPLAVLLEFVSDVAGVVLVLTGVVAGGLRAWAVLTGRPADQIELTTALGFAIGATIATLVVFIDLAWS